MRRCFSELASGGRWCVWLREDIMLSSMKVLFTGLHVILDPMRRRINVNADVIHPSFASSELATWSSQQV
jgi:hypothetical protein